MRNPFAGIFSLLRRPASDSSLGIDFGASALKIVQLRKKEGQAVLETYGSVALGPYAGVPAGRAARLGNDKLAEALADVVREAKATAKDAFVAVPMSASLAAAIEIPAPREEGTDVGTLIRFEARKFVPVPLTEVELSWYILSRDGGVVRALIIAMHKDVLERLRSVVALSGLSFSGFEIELESLARAAAPEPDEVVALLDIGASAASVAIVASGTIQDAHTLPQGAQDIHTAALARVFSEAREVLRHFEAKRGMSVGRVVLAGGPAGASGMREKAAEALGISAVLADPLNRLAAPAFLSPLLASAGPEFAVATGAALRGLEGRG